MSWHYLQGPEAVSSEAICWDGERFAPSKSTTMLGGYCLPDSVTGCCPTSRSGTTFAPSTDGPGADGLTLSPGDAPVRTSAPPEKAQASPESDPGFGLIWPALSARFDRATSSWRIHPCLFPEDSIPCSIALPRWGVMRGGELSELTTSAPLISGIGSGSGVNWPTIKSTDGERGGRGDLIQAVRGNPNSHYKMWQTPVADDAIDRAKGKMNSRGEPKLSAQVKMWATPCAQMANGEPEAFLERKRRSVARGNSMGISLTDLNMQVKAAERGLWPTPTVNGKHNRKGMSKNSGDGLSTAVKSFPTPTSSMATMADMEQARFAGNSDKRPSYQEAKAFRTPNASDARGWSHQSQAEREAKGQQVRLGHQLKAGGSLNPTWVEWLMGWPLGWTDLNVLEMDKFLSWRRSQLCALQKMTGA